jgi:hypothetical protein
MNIKCYVDKSTKKCTIELDNINIEEIKDEIINLHCNYATSDKYDEDDVFEMLSDEKVFWSFFNKLIALKANDAFGDFSLIDESCNKTNDNLISLFNSLYKNKQKNIDISDFILNDADVSILKLLAKNKKLSKKDKKNIFSILSENGIKIAKILIGDIKKPSTKLKKVANIFIEEINA